MFYREKQKFKLKFGVAFLLMATLVFGYFDKPYALGSAETDALQSQVDADQQKLDSLNQQIDSYQSQINDTQKQANTLANQLKILGLQISSTNTQIQATQAKIDEANAEIADVTAQIATTESDIAHEKDVLRDLIGDINDMDQRSPLEIALEDNNFTDFLNDLQYNTSIQARSEDALNQIKQLQADLQTRQDELTKQKTELDQDKQQLTVQQQSLSTQQATKTNLLNETKGQEKKYQQLLSDSQQAEAQINQEINDLDNQIAAKLGNNVLAPHKGLLAWPMKGTITQGYGNTGFTALGYSFHNGLDIAAPAGTAIRAAADGTVAATGNATPSGIDGAYGNWVAILHNTGAFAGHPIITLYGHMASFVLKKGQTVKAGDLVGYEGNTGNTTRIIYGPERGFHLHFTVFDAQGFTVVPGAYQNKYGAYQVPAGAPYNPLDFLD